MEKEQLFLKLMEIASTAKPDKKSGHHKHHEGDGMESSKSQKGEEGRDKKHRDPLKMPPSARSVLTILLREKKLNQRTLAKTANITAQGISDMLKKLEKDGIINKEAGNAYNENIIELTEKGEKLALEIQAKTKVHAEKMFKNFTHEELAMFENMLEKVYQNSKKEENIQ